MKLEKFVRDSRDLATVNAGDSVTNAAELMKHYGCGNVIVVRDTKVVGILTDRDIAVRCLAEKKDPRSTLIEECMTKNPITLGLDARGSDALAAMKENGISRIIVVDSSQKPQGVVTADHILKYIASELDELASLSQEMQRQERQESAA